jgi:hypothetical protein
MTPRSAVETRPSPVSIRVPGVASTAIRRVFSEPDTTATVLGTASHAVWLLVDREVIVVSTRDATRLPNGVEIAAGAAADVFRMVHHGAPVTIGSGQIALEGLTVDVVRWWNPRPILRRTSTTELAAAIVGLPSTVPGVESGPLFAALSAGIPSAILIAAESLIGRGPGLTPEGDDYLAGALAAIRMLAEAVGSADTAAMLDTVAGPLARLASIRTTTFSAALICHAADGRVAAPAGALLRALAGRGDVALSHRDLMHVGHTSGPALAAGMVLGARSLLQTQSRPNGGRR